MGKIELSFLQLLAQEEHWSLTEKAVVMDIKVGKRDWAVRCQIFRPTPLVISDFIRTGQKAAMDYDGS